MALHAAVTGRGVAAVGWAGLSHWSPKVAAWGGWAASFFCARASVSPLRCNGSAQPATGVRHASRRQVADGGGRDGGSRDVDGRGVGGGFGDRRTRTAPGPPAGWIADEGADGSQDPWPGYTVPPRPAECDDVPPPANLPPEGAIVHVCTY